MSSGPQSQVEGSQVEGARQQLNRLLTELTRLAQQDLPPAEFYGRFLQALLEALAAPAGGVWGRTAQGNLALQYQVNYRQVGLGEVEERRESHDELLRMAVQHPRPFHLLPRSSAGPQVDDHAAPGNPTDYIILIAPILA